MSFYTNTNNQKQLTTVVNVNSVINTINNVTRQLFKKVLPDIVSCKDTTYTRLVPHNDECNSNTVRWA